MPDTIPLAHFGDDAGPRRFGKHQCIQFIKDTGAALITGPGFFVFACDMRQALAFRNAGKAKNGI